MPMSLAASSAINGILTGKVYIAPVLSWVSQHQELSLKSQEKTTNTSTAPAMMSSMMMKTLFDTSYWKETGSVETFRSLAAHPISHEEYKVDVLTFFPLYFRNLIL